MPWLQIRGFHSRELQRTDKLDSYERRKFMSLKSLRSRQDLKVAALGVVFLWCLLLAAAGAQTVKFPPPKPIEEPAVPSTPRLGPPPPQIPPPAPYGRPVPVPVDRPVRPKVVSTIPATGISLAEPALREIRVTFDQDMDTRGFSFSGDLYYPDVVGTAVWIDSRTCSLPVALAPGRFYRVGINLGPSKEFQSINGTKADPYILYFTTVNAKPEDVAALSPPRIVTLRPDMGATGVTPGLVNMTVVFDQRMLKDFSPVAHDREKFPKDVGIGAWSADMRQLTFSARIEGQKEYVIGLNSTEQRGFQNDHGVPLSPVAWTFDTIR